MSAADEIQIVPSQELSDHILSEGEGHPSIILSPPHYIFVWVSPQEIA
jgi:hypothetical protein